MNESSKYGGLSFGENKGNINIENNGTLQQGITSELNEIDEALKQIHEEIQELSGDIRENAEDNLELLKSYIPTNDKEKVRRPLEKLGKVLGHAGSILTIASFFGIKIPL